MISNILRNLRDLLEEAHTHTMLNPRAAAIFQVLCQPNEKLGIMFISLTSYWLLATEDPPDKYVSSEDNFSRVEVSWN